MHDPDCQRGRVSKPNLQVSNTINGAFTPKNEVADTVSQYSRAGYLLATRHFGDWTLKNADGRRFLEKQE
jgi:hypothetical protein